MISDSLSKRLSQAMLYDAAKTRGTLVMNFDFHVFCLVTSGKSVLKQPFFYFRDSHSIPMGLCLTDMIFYRYSIPTSNVIKLKERPEKEHGL